MKWEENNELNGRYRDIYKNESAPVPERIWSGIDSELFPKKKRRGVVFWLSCTIGFLVIGGLTVYMTQRSVQQTRSQTALRDKIGNKKSEIAHQKTASENNTNETQEIKKNIDDLPTEVNYKVSSIRRNALGENKTYPFSSNKKGQVVSSEDELQLFQQENNKNDNTLSMVEYLPLKLVMPIESDELFIPEIFNNPFCQKRSCEPKFSLAYNVFVGKNMRMVSGNFDLDQSLAKRRSDKRIALNQLSHNLTLQYRISDKFALSTGLGYGIAQSTSKWYNRPTFLPAGQNSLRFQTSEGYCSVSDTSLINSLYNGDTSDLKMRFNQSVEVLTFPVMGSRTYFKNKWTTSLNFGLSADIHFNSKLSFNLEDNSGVRDVVAELDDTKTNLSLQALVGVRFNYRINSRFEAFGEQRLSVPVTSYLKTDTYKAYSANMNLGIGLRFYFPCELN